MTVAVRVAMAVTVCMLMIDMPGRVRMFHLNLQTLEDHPQKTQAGENPDELTRQKFHHSSTIILARGKINVHAVRTDCLCSNKEGVQQDRMAVFFVHSLVDPVGENTIRCSGLASIYPSKTGVL